MKVEDDLQLERFGRHVPHILANQLAITLLDQFLNQNGEESSFISANSPLPSIMRFHGALLFVDISGFTILSQRLPVDELRKHINGYFKKILDIVLKHGGDVIKFAGDAIFIVFQTKLDSMGIDIAAQKAAVKSAVVCGLEINRNCGDYRINFQQNTKTMNADDMMTTGPVSFPEDYAILNVHAGVSIGLMAGMDVGAFDRWEYLLLGTPLTDVAAAESEAEKGELVISGIAHELLCGDVEAVKEFRSTSSATKEGFWPCGCFRTATGLYKVKDSCSSPTVSNTSPSNEVDEDFEFEFFEFAMNNTLKAFENMKNTILRKYNEISTIEHKDSSITGIKTSTSLPALQRMQLQKRQEEAIFSYFLQWIATCLLHDIAGHVHEADRVNFQMTNINRTNCLVYCYKEITNGNYDLANSEQGEGLSGANLLSPVKSEGGFQLNPRTFSKDENVSARMRSIRKDESSVSIKVKSPGDQPETTFVNRLRNTTNHQRHSLRDRFQKMHDKTLQTDRDMHGELRNVIVIFVNIKIGSTSGSSSSSNLTSDNANSAPYDPMKLFTDVNKESCTYYNDVNQSVMEKFNFIRRSQAECDADLKLLHQYQACMTRVVKALHDHGGQLRQFIIDDKGTVCIGTFGLRGAVSSDNAAAAIEAAKSIVSSLRTVQIDAAVGITSGKAYCGIVGSPRRHEYAVMGPSTNLSARLMAKANPGEILCDNNLKKSDRTHYFKKMGEIKAKGYADMVPIYLPSLLRSSTLMFIPDTLSSDSYQPNGPHSGLLVNIAAAIENVDNDHESPKLPGVPAALSGSPIHHNLKTPAAALKAVRNSIWGREKEEYEAIYSIIDTLLPNKKIVDSFTIAIQTNTIPMDLEKPQIVHDVKLNVFLPAKVVILEGSNGIGKSLLVNQIGKKIEKFRSQMHHWNIIVYNGKSSTVNDMDPFKPWRSIIRHVLDRYANLGGYKELSPEISVATRAIFHSTDGDSGKDNPMYQRWKAGVQYISKYLTDEQRELLPLLSTAHFIPGLAENETTQKLSGSQKLIKVVSLLTAMLMHFPKLTSKVLLVVFDDLQNTDNHSLQLINELWQHNKGIIILSTLLKVIDNRILYNEDVTGGDVVSTRSSQKFHSRVTNPLLMTHLETFSSCTERYCKIMLNALEESPARQMIDQILGAYGIHQQLSDKAYAQMHSMSGGNPLYIYELTLSMIKYYQDNYQQAFFEELSSKQTRESGVDCPFLLTLSNFHTSRLDEVIYYRFDQLDAKTQLLLKFASVIASRGSHQGFTMKMLLSMLDGQQQSNNLFANLQYNEVTGEVSQESAEEMVMLFQRLLQSEEFIKIVPMSRRTSAAGSTRSGMVFTQSMRDLDSNSAIEEAISAAASNVSAADMEDPFTTTNSLKMKDPSFSLNEFYHTVLDFKVDMERQTIYDLMLDDQKESLHDRVASYFEKENAQKKKQKAGSGHYCLLTPSDFIEEGFHWEKARIWGFAMQCYYDAAMLLDGLGAYQESYEYLSLAYQMILGLRRQAMVKETFPTMSFTALIHVLQSHGVNLESFSMFKQKTVTDMRRKYSEKFPLATTTEGTYIPKYEIYKTFGGDSDLFEIGLHVLTKFAQTCLTLDKPVPFTARLFDEALQMIIVTWKNYHSFESAGNSPRSLTAKGDSMLSPGKGVSTPNIIDRGDSWQSLGSADPAVAMFGLRHPPVVFPILAGIAAMYRRNRLKDDEAHSKETILYDLIIHFASEIPNTTSAHSSSNPKISTTNTNIHYLQGICLKNILHFDAPHDMTMIELSDELMEKYKPEEHTQKLIETYGNDRIPYTIAMNCQILLLKGHVSKCEQYIQYLLNRIIPSMTHLHSVGIVTIPLCSIFRLLYQYQTCHSLFQEYRIMEQERLHAFSFFRDTNIFVHEWMRVQEEYHALLLHEQTTGKVVRMIGQSNFPSTGISLTNMITGNKGGDTSDTNEDTSEEHYRMLQKEIIEKKYLIPKVDDLITTTSIERRSLPFEVMEGFGCGIEYICANILYSLAMIQFHHQLEQESHVTVTGTGTGAGNSVHHTCTANSIHVKVVDVDDAKLPAPSLGMLARRPAKGNQEVLRHRYLLPEGRRLLYIALDYINASLVYCQDVPKLQYSWVIAALFKLEILLKLHQWYTHLALCVDTQQHQHHHTHTHAHTADHQEVMTMMYASIESLWQITTMEDYAFVQHYLHTLYSLFLSSLPPLHTSSTITATSTTTGEASKHAISKEEELHVMHKVASATFPVPLLTAIQNIDDIKTAILCLHTTAELSPVESYLDMLGNSIRKAHS